MVPAASGRLPGAAAAPSVGFRAAPAPRRQLCRPRVASVDAPPSSVQIDSVAYEAGCFTVQGSLLSTASPDRVYEVLTDYAALPRVFHNIDSAQVRWDKHSGAKHLVQTCKWAFLVFSGTFVTELAVREDPQHRRALAFSLAPPQAAGGGGGGAFMREFVGSWHIQPAAAGGGLTEVRHRLSVTPVVSPPQKIGDLSKSIFKRQVHSLLHDLQSELFRQQQQQQQQSQQR